MSIDVIWQESSRFRVVSESGFEFHVDADNQSAPCPTEVLLAALGACSATDVVAQLQEQGVELKALRNQVRYTLTDTSPQLYETATLHFTVTAREVTRIQVDQAARNAIEKYCHVCLMLQPRIKISHSVDIIQIDA